MTLGTGAFRLVERGSDHQGKTGLYSNTGSSYHQKESHIDIISPILILTRYFVPELGRVERELSFPESKQGGGAISLQASE